MLIGVLKEPHPETRVSLLPEHIASLKKMGASVIIEQSAGELSFAGDEQYKAAGAEVDNRDNILQQADVLLSINKLTPQDWAICRSKVLIGNFQPLFDPAVATTTSNKNITVFSLDMLPRTTRAQSMDILSSQANIAGYKAVLLGATHFPGYFPMLMTAAGSIPPAKVLILGAGVAGLHASATARRLGAVVEVFDTRPAVKEEVMSLGGKFIEVEGAADASKAGGYAVEQSAEFQQRQKAKIADSVKKADVVITTAQIPGRKAPILVTDEMLDSMRPGSVIIDLAASTGGNTSFTQNNKTVVYNGVQIIGNSSLQSTVPNHASKLYGKNILNFLPLILQKDGTLNLNFHDDLVKGSAIFHNGEIVNERLLTHLQNSK